MSLKAKIEAVVYAAEEPVTLAQLSALFADEALAWKREHEPQPAPSEAPPAAAEQQEELAGLVAPEPAGSEAESGPEAGTTSLEPESSAEPEAQATPEGEETAPAAVGGGAEAEAAAKAANAADADAEAKRAARLKDREVRDVLRRLLDELIEEYARSDRGLEVREIAGGYRVGTKPEYHDSVRAFVKSLKPPMKLSLQALETLAVIAYKQPITSPEISEVRGVDSAGVLGSLISRKLITTAGRKQVIGRPILYKTTKEFLLRFGLKDLNELPSIEEFEKMAGELADAEDTAPEQPGADSELPFEARAAGGEPPSEAEAVEAEPVESTETESVSTESVALNPSLPEAETETAAEAEEAAQSSETTREA